MAFCCSDSMSSKSLLEVVKECDNWPYKQDALTTSAIELRLEDGTTAVGLLLPNVVALIKDYLKTPSFSTDAPAFILDSDHVRFHSSINSIEKRTLEIEKIVKHWKDTDVLECLRGWRDETYPVYFTKTRFNDSLAFTLERAASWAFGVATFGVHINGFVYNDKNELQMWIARRAATKSTWPGFLDNTCAGGISHGSGVFETLVKECSEEGSIPSSLSETAIAVGAVTYMTVTSLGISPETQYVYDLKLPSDFKPSPNDGEVGDFYLLSIPQVLQKLKDGEFKPNCGLVVIDFLIRHGYITPDEEPDLAVIQARCHRPSPFMPL